MGLPMILLFLFIMIMAYICYETIKQHEMLSFAVLQYELAIWGIPKDADYTEYVKYLFNLKGMSGGLCLFLTEYKYVKSSHKAKNIYWVKRNLQKKGVHSVFCTNWWCDPSSFDKKNLEFRLHILKKELELVNKYGYFARFIKY